MKRRTSRISAGHEKQAGNLQPKLQWFYLCLPCMQTSFWEQRATRDRVGSSSIFPEHNTCSQPSDVWQKTWARGREPERKGAGAGLDILKKNFSSDQLDLAECLRQSKELSASFHSLLSRFSFLQLCTYLLTTSLPKIEKQWKLSDPGCKNLHKQKVPPLTQAVSH